MKPWSWHVSSCILIYFAHSQRAGWIWMAGGVPTSVLLSDKFAAGVQLDLYVMPRRWHARSARRSWDWSRSSSHWQNMTKRYIIEKDKRVAFVNVILCAAIHISYSVIRTRYTRYRLPGSRSCFVKLLLCLSRSFSCHDVAVLES